jgi:hypothetical protein
MRFAVAHAVPSHVLPVGTSSPFAGGEPRPSAMTTTRQSFSRALPGRYRPGADRRAEQCQHGGDRCLSCEHGETLRSELRTGPGKRDGALRADRCISHGTCQSKCHPLRPPPIPGLGESGTGRCKSGKAGDVHPVGLSNIVFNGSRLLQSRGYRPYTTRVDTNKRRATRPRALLPCVGSHSLPGSVASALAAVKAGPPHAKE